MITISSFAEHPQLVPEVVEIAWREWGASLREQERERWLAEAELDSADRPPWVCGMVVRPEYRGAGVGRRLLAALEDFAAGHGVPRLWAFTEDAQGAAGFYEQCGWRRHGQAVEHGDPGVVLTHVLS
jgi:GNAT superfamily N-acetyltransferase